MSPASVLLDLSTRCEERLLCSADVGGGSLRSFERVLAPAVEISGPLQVEKDVHRPLSGLEQCY